MYKPKWNDKNPYSFFWNYRKNSESAFLNERLLILNQFPILNINVVLIQALGNGFLALFEVISDNLNVFARLSSEVFTRMRQ